MSGEAPPPFSEGQVLEGRYRIESLLGAGGMGVVALAHHLHLDERVALKFILPERIHDQTVIDRFLVEARAAAKLKSEHAVRVFDASKLPDGTPYLVMEYIEGEDLARRLRRGPLEVEEAVTYILQASEALAEAHALGIVHRDLKPANLFLTKRPDGTPSIKVLDFGISKLITETNADALTSSQNVLGSPPYMSPEQLSSSKSVDHRADIWALGVTLFELVTTKRPFNGGTLPEMCVAILTTPPSLARTVRPELPAALDDVLAGCFEKDREHRFASLADLADELLPLAPSAKASVDRIARLAKTSVPTLSPAEEEPLPESTRARRTQSIDASVVDLPKITPPPAPEPPAVSSPPRRGTAVAIGAAVGLFAISVTAYVATRGPAPSGPTGVVAAPPPSVTASAMAIVSSPAPVSSSAEKPPVMVMASAPSPPPAVPAKPRTAPSTRADQKGLAGDNPFK
ncbi:MAG: serine/threonine-protein kinase [Labilithrix sp.]